MNSDQTNQVKNDTATPDAPITFADFTKVTIQIGTIAKVEVVENADTLLRLVVDFGSETRQIISGIRQLVDDPQTLVDTQAPFVTNLKPRVIRGLESQGMILAAGQGETFAFLRPERALPAGTLVR